MGISVKPLGSVNAETGVVTPAPDAKPARMLYFVRTAPMDYDGSAVKYAAGSRPRKVNVTSELKAPKLKPRVVAERTKTDKADPPVTTVVREANIILRLRMGNNVFAGNFEDVTKLTTPPRPFNEDAKTPFVLTGSGADSFLNITGKGAMISVLELARGDAINHITVWNTASGRRAASTKRTIENNVDPPPPPATPTSTT
jgi:hypothetical protein